MAHTTSSSSAPKAPLDPSKWRKVPTYAVIAGVVFLGIGAFAVSHQGGNVGQQFGYSWLLGFMFYLSLAMGGLFLVLAHHLFDASWSVPIRRYCEHLACLVLPLAFCFIPIALLAPKIYPWMGPAMQANPDPMKRKPDPKSCRRACAAAECFQKS